MIIADDNLTLIWTKILMGVFGERKSTENFSKKMKSPYLDVNLMVFSLLTAEDVPKDPPGEEEHDIGGQRIAARDESVECGSGFGWMLCPDPIAGIHGDEEQRDGKNAEIVVLQSLEEMAVEQCMECPLGAARRALVSGDELQDALGHNDRLLGVGYIIKNSRQYANDGNQYVGQKSFSRRMHKKRAYSGFPH
mgnify:CR=1 FL=1